MNPQIRWKGIERLAWMGIVSLLIAPLCYSVPHYIINSSVDVRPKAIRSGNIGSAAATSGWVLKADGSGGSSFGAASTGVALGDSPTWTGIHTWSPSSQTGNTLNVNASGVTYSGESITTDRGTGMSITKNGNTGVDDTGTANLALTRVGSDTNGTGMLTFVQSGSATGPFIKATNGSSKFELGLNGSIFSAFLANAGYLSTDGSGNFISNVGTPLTSTPSWDSTLGVSNTAAHTILFSPDDTYNIGAVGATRPHNIYVATNVNVGGTVLASGGLSSGNNLAITNTGTGTLTLQGGTSSGYVDIISTANPHLDVPAITTSATAGSNGAVPAQVDGYLAVVVNGTTYKIPLFH